FPIRKQRVGLPHIRGFKVCRENADDLRRNSIKHERRADRISRASEPRLPEAVAYQRDVLALLRLFVGKTASVQGPTAKEWKQIGGAPCDTDPFRPVFIHQRRRDGIKDANVCEVPALATPLLDSPVTRAALKVWVVSPGPQHCELLRGPIRQRAE